MKMMHAFLGLAAGSAMIATPVNAQPVPPTPPGGPQIQPPRPGGPQIQPPRPVRPIIVRPQPGGPQIQPPRPVRPRPPVPPRPVVPIIVNPGWGSWNPGWAWGRAVLYSGSYYSGNFMTVRSSIPDLRAYGFNDRAMSIHSRGRWQLCSKANYRGKCSTVAGSDPSFGKLAGKVSSIRYLGR